MRLRDGAPSASGNRPLPHIRRTVLLKRYFDVLSTTTTQPIVEHRCKISPTKISDNNNLAILLTPGCRISSLEPA
ncbi:hypothetical protein EMPG_16707 [Blastomyces silverae]|uniref:Uncharacterized protein n=1 Tax=Blastomyces silverae TaxID=2060906 RepID=A0A0H1BF93_9EURO|nr:hypothetical protein EMPG_16707 [Blastomyces silverae]